MPGLNAEKIAEICKTSVGVVYSLTKTILAEPIKIKGQRTREYKFNDALTIVGCHLLKKRGVQVEAINDIGPFLNDEFALVSQRQDYRPMIFASPTQFDFWIVTVTDCKKEAIQTINDCPHATFVNVRKIYHEAQQEISKNA